MQVKSTTEEGGARGTLTIEIRRHHFNRQIDVPASCPPPVAAPRIIEEIALEISGEKGCMFIAKARNTALDSHSVLARQILARV